MRPQSSPFTEEDGIQQAHLLIIRGQTQEAARLLAQLSAAFPGSADIQRLMAIVIINGNAVALPPPQPRVSIWLREFPGAIAYPILMGLAFFGFGAFMTGRALRAAFASGLSGSMQIQGNVRVVSVPISAQLTRGFGLLAISFLFLGIAAFVAKQRPTG